MNPENPSNPALLLRTEDLSPAVRRFFFRFEHLEQFPFQPGQFCILSQDPSLPAEYSRSYSIASAPGELPANVIELCIVRKPGGYMSEILFGMKPGDTLWASEAKGEFVLPEAIDKDLCFICTGTGVAPFRSMIRHVLNQDIPRKNIYLIFGNRFENDILYRKEFEELVTIHSDFRFNPVLSRENWSGEKGYVHPVFEREFSDGRDAWFYLCGWTAMIKEARNRLKAMGYNRRQYKAEQYD